MPTRPRTSSAHCGTGHRTRLADRVHSKPHGATSAARRLDKRYRAANVCWTPTFFSLSFFLKPPLLFPPCTLRCVSLSVLVPSHLPPCTSNPILAPCPVSLIPHHFLYHPHQGTATCNFCSASPHPNKRGFYDPSACVSQSRARPQVARSSVSRHVSQSHRVLTQGMHVRRQSCGAASGQGGTWSSWQAIQTSCPKFNCEQSRSTGVSDSSTSQWQHAENM